MIFTPNSEVRLLDVPLDKTKKHNIKFSSISEQTSYFSSKTVDIFDKVQYVKQNNSFDIEGELDDFWNVNYVMYQNTNHGSRWFYAYVTRKEYVAEKVTRIFIETDTYQTYTFHSTIKPSFTVREHVSDDTVGKHLFEEGLEYGEYIHKSYSKTNLFSDLAFVIAISDMSPLLPDGVTATPRVYDNMYSGLIYWAFSYDNISGMNAFINLFDGKLDAISFIFTIPLAFLPDQSDGQILSGESGSPVAYEFNLSYDNLDGYTPKNNKLFTYPYNFLSVSNNQGNFAEYRFEDFYLGTSGKPTFRIRSHIAPNPNVICTPLNYKADVFGEVPEYSLSLSGYPLCSWNADVYKNWLAQNTANVALGAVGGIAGIIGGIATGNLLAVGGGIMAISSQLAQITKASKQPDQARGNTNNGSFNIAHNRQDFYFIHNTIKSEYAKRIDQFLTMFGYKINQVKVPETHSRRYWNYIQTIDINIVGDVPSDDMEELKSLYNNGLTLWHDPSKMFDYSLDNSIL